MRNKTKEYQNVPEDHREADPGRRCSPERRRGRDEEDEVEDCIHDRPNESSFLKQILY